MDWYGCEMPGICMPAKGGPLGKDGMECPAFCPAKCGPEEMPCWGGMDANDCMMPDTCIPMKGPMGKDGIECPSFCPYNCPPDMIQCPGEMDDFGCMMPEWCAPAKDGCVPAK